MNWLADNALVMWVGGAVALTMALVVYLQTLSPKALAAMVVVVVATASLLAAEYVLETPREAVERALYELAAAVEANDVPGTLALLAPSAMPRVRDEIEAKMPLVRIERARVLGTPNIAIAEGPNPTTATVHCRGMILAVVKQTGMKGGAEDELTLTFTRQGSRWLLDDYTSKRDWDRALGR